MGRKLTTHLLKQDAKRIVIYSRNESKQVEMAQEFTDPRMRFFIGDIRDRRRLVTALKGIDTVVHAAALKHVPVCQYNWREAKRTNVDGTENVIDACIEAGVERAVMLATDKGVYAHNFYGKTKGLAEEMFILANSEKSIFRVARYGNISGSSGSAIPHFKSLVAAGATELPVTVPNMTRFYMGFQDAINLVMDALAGQPQVIYVAKAPSYSLIRLCVALGCEMKPTGSRPGEKYHELLINEYESCRTFDCGDHFEIVPEDPYDDDITFSDGKLVDPWYSYDSYNNTNWLSVDELSRRIKGI